MGDRRRSRIGAAALACALAVAVAVAPGSRAEPLPAPLDLFASPSGTGEACTASAPCALDTAQTVARRWAGQRSVTVELPKRDVPHVQAALFFR